MYFKKIRTLQKSKTHTNQVVTKFKGDGAVVVLCIFRMSLERPNFHSISDWALTINLEDKY